MGYRLAAGGLAGRLRAGDGGVGPCIEDAWVRQIARHWTTLTRKAARLAPPAERLHALADARDDAAARIRNLPVFAICQAMAALGLIAIGTSTLIYWQKSQPDRRASALNQITVAAAPVQPPKVAERIMRVADIQPPIAPVAPIDTKPAADPAPSISAPPLVLADAVPAATTLPPAVMPEDPPAPKPPAHAPHAAHLIHTQEALAVLRPTQGALRIAPAPHILSVLATRPLPRLHHAPRAVITRYDMPHWLTEPRAPLIMSEPPHALALPLQYAAPPLVARPHVDRFAAGSYVPPMMPGTFQ